uniref:Immunoglobulin V-set domain-containing protein n=1 Tax=Oncorhynchus kisutch TaxID=8019 RepID=A0A8C7D2H2_ONCKI
MGLSPLSLFTGSSAHKVHQSPSALIKNHGSSVDQEIHCSHSIANYDRMLWYKQDISRTLKLLGYLNLNYAYSEEYVKGKIQIQGDGRKAYLHLVSLRGPEHSAVYYCAASQHSDNHQHDQASHTCSNSTTMGDRY